MKSHKTTIELDTELVEQARAVLGTTGFKDTIDTALREVIALDARLRVIAQLQASDIDVDALRREAWGE